MDKGGQQKSSIFFFSSGKSIFLKLQGLFEPLTHELEWVLECSAILKFSVSLMFSLQQAKGKKKIFSFQ